MALRIQPITSAFSPDISKDVLASSLRTPCLRSAFSRLRNPTRRVASSVSSSQLASASSDDLKLAEGRHSDVFPLPSSSELKQVLNLLDADKDGRICFSVLDALLSVAYGHPLRLSPAHPGVDMVELPAQSEESTGHIPALSEESNSGSEEGTVLSPRNRITCKQSWKDIGMRMRSPSGRVDVSKILPALEGSSLLNQDLEDSTSALSAGSSGSTGTSSRPTTASSISSRGLTLTEYVAAFRTYDTDFNGVICAEDLQEALEFLTGEDVPVERCEAVIREADANSDGVIDLKEFGDLLASMRAARTAL